MIPSEGPSPYSQHLGMGQRDSSKVQPGTGWGRAANAVAEYMAGARKRRGRSALELTFHVGGRRHRARSRDVLPREALLCQHLSATDRTSCSPPAAPSPRPACQPHLRGRGPLSRSSIVIHRFRHGGEMPKVLRDLRRRRIGVAIDPDHVLVEILGKRLPHGSYPSSADIHRRRSECHLSVPQTRWPRPGCAHARPVRRRAPP